MQQWILTLIIIIAVYTQAGADSVASKVYHWDTLKVEQIETGERRPILEGSSTHLDFFAVHASTVQPGVALHASHTHSDMEELVIVKEGQLRVSIKEENKVMGPGSIAYFLPGDEHGLSNGGDTPVTYYILRFKAKAPIDTERGKASGGSFMMDIEDLPFKASDKGGGRPYFDRETALFRRFEMHTTMLNEGVTSHAVHTHSEEEIILVMRGTVDESIDGAHHKAGVGDVIFLDSQVPHNIKNDGSGACEYFAFKWH